MIGFVGIGIMGKGMLKNLIEKLTVQSVPVSSIVYNFYFEVFSAFMSWFRVVDLLSGTEIAPYVKKFYHFIAKTEKFYIFSKSMCL
jgi:hypothetical protein